MSTVVATATLMAGTSFHVSAYDICDVNRDGYVNVRDASAIASYCNGSLYADDYNRFDTDRNLVVNPMDQQRVLSKISGYSHSSLYYSRERGACLTAPTVSGFTPDSAASSIGSRDYMRYSYAQGRQLSNYALTPTTNMLTSTSSNANTRAVIGNDEREPSKVKENFGIVTIECNGGWGTGFIVGDHHIATAAHCVYDEDIKQWKNITKINTYSQTGNKFGTLTPVEVHVPRLFPITADTTPTSENMYDYALITVEEDLSNYLQFDLGVTYNVNATNYTNIPIYVTGAPGYKPNVIYVKNELMQLYTAEGRVISRQCDTNELLTNTSLLYYDTDAKDGQSGAPVYTITKNTINGQLSYTYTVIAVHSGGIANSRNWGSLITKYHLQFYKNNTVANY